METHVCKVEIPQYIENNDATGISWININCLKDCIENNTIVLSKHCKINTFYPIKPSNFKFYIKFKSVN